MIYKFVDLDVHSHYHWVNEDIFKKKLYSTEFISALGLLWKIVYIQFMYAQAETTYKALIP